ncbi:MAG: hypothetical protein LBO07_03240 [Coriobacteriales bacterium]|jgi:hypothetical protein|nr:hypothetical protein [Coriobacteriales bacterium]
MIRGEQTAEDTKKKKKTGLHTLSLLGGTVFFAVVVALAVNRSRRVREEIDAQIRLFLETTRTALLHYQRALQGIKRLSDETKSATKKSKNEEAGALPARLPPENESPEDEYDALWAPLEKAVRSAQTGRLSG